MGDLRHQSFSIPGPARHMDGSAVLALKPRVLALKRYNTHTA
jgi:hypothetical protein